MKFSTARILLVPTLFLGSLTSGEVCKPDCSNMATCDQLVADLNLGSDDCASKPVISFPKLKFCGAVSSLDPDVDSNYDDFEDYDIDLYTPVGAPNSVTTSISFPILQACDFIDFDAEYYSSTPGFTKLQTVSFPELLHADGIELDCGEEDSDDGPYCPALTSISFPKLVGVGDLAIGNFWRTSAVISFPELKKVDDDIEVYYLGANMQVSFPKLTYAEVFEYEYNDLRTLELPELNMLDDLYVSYNNHLLSVSFPKLSYVGCEFEVDNNYLLTSISAPYAENAVYDGLGDNDFDSNPSLVTFDFGTKRHAANEASAALQAAQVQAAESQAAQAQSAQAQAAETEEATASASTTATVAIVFACLIAVAAAVLIIIYCMKKSKAQVNPLPRCTF